MAHEMWPEFVSCDVARKKEPRLKAGFEGLSMGRVLPAPAAPISTIPAAATAPAATAELRPGRALLGLVHAQRTAAHFEAVHRLDGVLGIARGHLDEAEAAGTAGFPIIDELHRVHLA